MNRPSPGLLQHLPMLALLVTAALVATVVPATETHARGLEEKAWGKALARLKAATESGNAASIGEAAKALARDDSVRAAKALTTVAIASAGSGAHEAVAAAMSTFTEKRARRYVTDGARKHKDRRVRWLMVLALGRSDWEEAPEALAQVLEARDPGLASEAVRGLQKRRNAASVEMLIAFLEEFDAKHPPKLRPAGGDSVHDAVVTALRDLTGEDLEDGVDWRNWWTQHASSFNPQAPGKKTEKPGSGHKLVTRLRERRPDAFRSLEELQKDDILVVTGAFDQVQDVLDVLKLPHTVVPRADFSKTPLNPKQVIIFNCDQETGKLPPVDQARLREFVARGGYVFTSDWELQNVVAPSFDGELTMAGSTEEFKVGIAPAKGAERHPLLRDVFPADPFKAAAFRWQIDAVSFTVRPGKRATVLIHSDELEKRHGSGIVAAVFRYGPGAGRGGASRQRPRPTTGGGSRSGRSASERVPGSVLHVLSHFQKQRDESGDGFALQQMLLNFIVEKQAFRRRAAGR